MSGFSTAAARTHEAVRRRHPASSTLAASLATHHGVHTQVLAQLRPSARMRELAAPTWHGGAGRATTGQEHTEEGRG